MIRVAILGGGLLCVVVSGSRVLDKEEQQPRFYDEIAFSEYEDDGEEWGHYNPIPEMYNEEQRLGSIQRNSNHRKKTGQSNVQEMTNNPFDDPFFNEFVRKHKKKQEQVMVQKTTKDQVKPPDHQLLQSPLLQLRNKQLRSPIYRRNLRKR